MTQEFRDELVAEHMKEYGALDILVNKCVLVSDFRKHCFRKSDRDRDFRGDKLTQKTFCSASKQIQCKDLADIDVRSRLKTPPSSRAFALNSLPPLTDEERRVDLPVQHHRLHRSRQVCLFPFGYALPGPQCLPCPPFVSTGPPSRT